MLNGDIFVASNLGCCELSKLVVDEAMVIKGVPSTGQATCFGAFCSCDLTRSLIPGTPVTFQCRGGLWLPGLVGSLQTDQAHGPIIKPREILLLRDVSLHAGVGSHASAHTSLLLRIVI